MRITTLLFVSLTAVAFAADLPVREVILYKSGVGYFARSGLLSAGEGGRLDFRADEMNDVLKSLTLTDNSGAPIRGLRYDSSEPLGKKLEDFPFAVAEGQPLSSFLDHLRGARIELKSPSETVTGAIVSARMMAAGEKEPEREQLTLLLDSGDLRTVDLGAITSLHFTDQKLQTQLKDYLAAVAQARSKDKRSVYIDSTDARGREVSASYMIPQPVWKSSYRLLFRDTGDATLEGWAVVDNTTGDDWTNVKLAVVSGRPVSFISRLYEPFYVQRMTADVLNATAQAPIVYQGAVQQQMETQRAGFGGYGSGAGVGIVGGVERRMMKNKSLAMPMAAPPPPPASSEAVTVTSDGPVQADQLNAFQPDTEARDLGDLFEYRFGNPVTIHKNESAMLPFLKQKIAARKLLIYSESYGLNPMSAAELTNASGKTLDGGPITVFDGDSYAGEALMNTVKTGDKRLISYAVDLGTRVGTQDESDTARILEVHASRGVITTKNAMRETKTYTVRNVDQKAKTILIEQPIRTGYKLLNQKPVETTATMRRFEVKLAPGATEKFPITEETVYDQTMAVSNFTPDVLVEFTTGKAIGDDGRKQLQQVLDQKQRITEAETSIVRTRNEMNDLSQREERLRQNVNTLSHVPGQQEQVETWARQLGADEARLAALRDQSAELEKNKTALQAALDGMISKLQF